MKKVWFSGDFHLGHANVIRYSNRPWIMVNEMNDGLIERWNALVGKNDSVYFLGDFCLTSKIELVDEWFGRLNGQWRIIIGNHDKGWLKKFDKLKNKDKIKWVKHYAERTFVVDGVKYKFVLCHFPMLFWHNSHHGSIMLHGHSHGNANSHNEGLRRMDVGVDCNNWYPVLLENIVTMMKDVGLNPHHGQDNE